MRRALFTIVALVLAADAASNEGSPPPRRSEDSVWEVAEETSLASPAPPAFRLDRNALKLGLRDAPVESRTGPTDPGVPITMPMPDGSFARFLVVESPMMARGLAERFPQIRTYGGHAVEDRSTTIRFDVSPRGLHAIVLGTDGAVWIAPQKDGDLETHISQRGLDGSLGATGECLAHDAPKGGDDPRPKRTAGASIEGGPVQSENAGTLRIYRLAAAATAEFTWQNGASIDSALAAIVTVINSVNAIYRRELGIFLDVVEDNDVLIFLNTQTDGYASGDLICEDPGSTSCTVQQCLLHDNQCAVDFLIGRDNYDLGIVFDGTNASGGATGRAGLAVVCDPLWKAQAATAGTGVVITAHEIGHMFGGHHTFNDGTNGSCGGLLGSSQRDGAWAVEPASGSTLMSYGGTCGAADLQSTRDPYFHAVNLVDMLAFVEGGGGDACEDRAFTGNFAPVIQGFTPPRTIPILTPFQLAAQAYDPNGDLLTYVWEETDAGTASPPEGDDGSRAIFRSYLPGPDPFRNLPNLQFVLGNANIPPATYTGMGVFGTCGGGATCLTGEAPVVTGRTMEFRLTVRDGVDGISIADTEIVSHAGSGPFAVAQPNGGEVWTEGARRTVTWNTANTNNPPIGCANVSIRLSVDGGATWPHTLAAVTPNDGLEVVQVPFGETNSARIKVEAVGNIFFDVSDSNLTIERLQVTNTNDSGRGSLRQAILDANDIPGGWSIPFAIPGTGVKTIRPLTPLPPLTRSNQLDGWLQGGPDYEGPPLIELDGSLSAPNPDDSPANGLVIRAANCFINGLTINRFAGNGIVVEGSAAVANGIQNNHIGTNPAGAIALGNGLSGVLITGGHTNLLWRNVISGNAVGVTISGAGTHTNTLLRNLIGTDASGTLRIPNVQDGVRIAGSAGNAVGDGLPGNGNVISGNGSLYQGGPVVLTLADGIEISGGGASGNVVRGNLVGVSAEGLGGPDNTGSGVRIDGAPNTIVGGTGPLERNLIGDRGVLAHPLNHGVEVVGLGATGTVIQGNSIGLDASGTIELGHRGSGIYIDGAPGVLIGGTTAAARNLIAGSNSYGGIRIGGGATGTVVQGNYIGTNAAGTAAVGNNFAGIYVESGQNTIGGTVAGAGNLISGNALGVWIEASGTSNNTVQGNLIGTDATGTLDLGNGNHGIQIRGSTNTLIGGTSAAARNVISGNGVNAVYVTQGVGVNAQGTVIRGNYMGTNAAGTAAIPNGGGVGLYEVSGVSIGGTAAGAGNVIAASVGAVNYGVEVYSFSHTTSGVVIQGNLIGTNAAGTAPLGNTGEGVRIIAVGTLTLGGSAAGAGNLISASGQYGVRLGGSSSVVVQGNRVGTDVSGTLNFGNGWSGIYVGSGTHLIGGTAPGEGNLVAFNSLPNQGFNYAAIDIDVPGQSIRGNSVLSNSGLGIDVNGLGVTPNDSCDTDSGLNDWQNYPVLTSAVQAGPLTGIEGTLHSAPGTQFTLDFYASPSCDASGHGEGVTYLGSTTVSTDGSCNGSFSTSVPIPVGGVITATATDPAGNTSEFSACRAVAPGSVGEATALTWVAGSKAELTWVPASGATLHRLLRGVRSDLPKLLDATPDACERWSGSATTTGAVLTEDPLTVPGRLYWYLVVGSNGIDQGSAGRATSAIRNATSLGACP